MNIKNVVVTHNALTVPSSKNSVMTFGATSKGKVRALLRTFGNDYDVIAKPFIE